MDPKFTPEDYVGVLPFMTPRQKNEYLVEHSIPRRWRNETKLPRVLEPLSVAKSASLLFDKVVALDWKEYAEGVLGFEDAADPEYWGDLGADEAAKWEMNEIRYLFDNDILIDAEDELYGLAGEHSEPRSVAYHAISQSPEPKGIPRDELSVWLEADHTRRSIQILAALTGAEVVGAVDLFAEMWKPPIRAATSSKEDVFRLLLKRVPVVHQATPWQAIAEARADPDLRARLATLRGWASEVAKGTSSQAEIKDKIESAVADYETFLRVHRIEARRGALESVVVGGAEILENIKDLKFSSIAKRLFRIGRVRTEYLEAELAAPGRQLSYMARLRHRLPQAGP